MTQQQGYEKEFGWDDTIEYDTPDFITLQPGDYWFTVESFERQRHTPKPNSQSKNPLPACNKAVIKLMIETSEGITFATHNLFLHSRTEGLLSAFFGAIGQKKHGEPLRMNWNSVIGSVGVATFKNREYKGNVYNEVDRMIYVDDVDLSKIKNTKPGQAYANPSTNMQQPPTNNQTGFTPGQF